MREEKVHRLINDDQVTIVKKSSKNIYARIIYYFFGIVLSLIFLFPFFYMLATSTKSEETIAQHAGTLMMFVPDLSNIGSVFDNYAFLMDEYNIFRQVLITVTYAAVIIVLNVLINGLAAYAICKLRFPGKPFFNFLILFLIVVPVETSILPLLLVCKKLLGLTGQSAVWAMILPASISVFNIFLFIQFFSSIPKEFEEAARMDGANTVKVFFKVILPLSKPIIATVAVFCFIGVWNDYLWPSMVFIDSSLRDFLPIQNVIQSISSRNDLSSGIKMASLVISSLPIFIVYVAAQKYIVKGFGAGGLKL